MSVVLTLYGRPDCHLCEVAREQILALRDAGASFELREVDIDRDEKLQAAYLEKVPVVALNGEVVSELELDLGALRARLDTVRA